MEMKKSMTTIYPRCRKFSIEPPLQLGRFCITHTIAITEADVVYIPSPTIPTIITKIYEVPLPDDSLLRINRGVEILCDIDRRQSCRNIFKIAYKNISRQTKDKNVFMRVIKIWGTLHEAKRFDYRIMFLI